MESYEKIYETICRVCLEQSDRDKMVSLLENTSQSELSCYGKAVSTFARFSIKTDDNFPKALCEKCLYLLKQAIRFKFKCEGTQKILEIISKVSDNQKQNIVEKVVEYALFKQYLPDLSTEESSAKSVSKKSEENCTNFEENCSENEECQQLFDDLSHDIDQNFFDEIQLQHLNKELQGDEILERLESVVQSNSNILNTEHNIYSKKRRLRCNNKIKPKLMRYAIIAQQKVKKKNIICKICNRILANENTYHYHMQRHNGCRFICEHCAKGFPLLSELQIHLTARHGMGPYLQCSQCSYKASRRFDLIEHERIHTGERPYTCEKCGLTFRRRAIWKKHLLHHNEKTVECPLCPKKFYKRSDMIAHKNSIHERLYVYLCNKCGATYAKTDTVRKHLLERHGIPKALQGKITMIRKRREGMNSPSH